MIHSHFAPGGRARSTPGSRSWALAASQAHHHVMRGMRTPEEILGRDGELPAPDALLGHLARGAAALILGESGVDRTALASEAMIRSRGLDAMAWSTGGTARVVDQVTGRPDRRGSAGGARPPRRGMSPLPRAA